MARDLYLHCINDTITHLHHIDFVSGPYLEKLYGGDVHKEFRDYAKEIREKVNRIHDELMEYLKVYEKYKDVSGYNHLCKPPRKTHKKND